MNFGIPRERQPSEFRVGLSPAGVRLLVEWGHTGYVEQGAGEGAGIVTTRHDVHFVVTEYGVADLYGKTLRQRARALIHIAHPDFREELEGAAAELRYL